MTTTLAQLRTLIAGNLVRSDLNTEITQAINDAIEYYQVKRFWFNEKVGTFSTVAGQKSYGSADSVPTDILEFDSIKVTDDSTFSYPDPVTYSEIEKIDYNSFQSLPEKYAYYQEKIYFYPLPLEVYTVTVSYLQSYSALSADSDSNDFTNSARAMIENRATALVFVRKLRIQEQANTYFQLAKDEYDNLQERTERIKSTGSVTPTQW